MATASPRVRYYRFEDIPTVRELLRLQGQSRIGEANSTAFFQVSSLAFCTIVSLTLIDLLGLTPPQKPWKEAFCSPEMFNGIVAWTMVLPMFAAVGGVMLLAFYLRHRREIQPDTLEYEQVEKFGSSGRQGLWLAEDEYGTTGCVGLTIVTKPTTDASTSSTDKGDEKSPEEESSTSNAVAVPTAVGKISHLVISQQTPSTSTVDAALVAHVLRVAFERASDSSPDPPLEAVTASLYPAADKTLVDTLKLFGFKKATASTAGARSSLLDNIWPVYTTKKEYILERSALASWGS
jgi:hypothetical protein